MKLSRISYMSAIFFGILALVWNLFQGILQLIIMYVYPQITSAGGVSLLQTLLVVPVVSGVLWFVIFLVAILIYNQIAKAVPISWEVKK